MWDNELSPNLTDSVGIARESYKATRYTQINNVLLLLALTKPLGVCLGPVHVHRPEVF